MNILHIITTINLGGAENHLLDLVREQVKKGCKVTIVHLKGDGFWKSEYDKIKVSVHNLQITNYLSLHKVFILRNIISKSRPEIIHAHMPPAELFTNLALTTIKNKIPLIISKHNDERFAPIPNNISNFLAKWCARRAKNIISISKAVKEYTDEKLGAEFHIKNQVIYYGIDTNRFTNINQDKVKDLRYSWNAQNSIVFGTVARLTAQKSLDTLINAFNQLSKTHDNIKLVIAGEGELEKPLKELVKSLNIENIVIFTGKRTDIEVIMNTFDVFTLTSIYEGFGLVLIEAMASSKPIIASRVSAIPEVVKERENALLFTPQNSAELYKCFIEILDPNRRKSFSNASLERVKNKFCLAQMTESTLMVYRQSLS